MVIPRYKFSASDASFIFLHRTFRERESRKHDPSYLCGFCKCLLKTFDSKGTPSIEYTRMRQRRGEGEEMSLRQIKFAEGLLLRITVQREKDLQGKPAILRTRQHFHALPQQIQGQLQPSFLQMR